MDWMSFVSLGVNAGDSSGVVVYCLLSFFPKKLECAHGVNITGGV